MDPACPGRRRRSPVYPQVPNAVLRGVIWRCAVSGSGFTRPVELTASARDPPPLRIAVSERFFCSNTLKKRSVLDTLRQGYFVATSRHLDTPCRVARLGVEALTCSTIDLTRVTSCASRRKTWPSRGPLCRRCRTRIPQFRDLSPEAADRVRSLIRLGNEVGAMTELAKETECPQRWAKIWVIHNGRSKSGFGGPPCPHCGEALASPNASQCLSCGADWHSEPGARK